MSRNIHVWMKGMDRSIYEISVFYGFRILQALTTTISLHLWIRPRRRDCEEMAYSVKIKMS